jgi:hypothetical protein
MSGQSEPAPIRYTAIAAHGTIPATHPNANGVHETGSPGVFVVSISHPNRIIEALIPKSASRAATSVIPVIPAMMTIMSDADSAYSVHRNRLRHCSSSRMYRPCPHGDATVACANAEMISNAAIAQPSR